MAVQPLPGAGPGGGGPPGLPGRPCLPPGAQGLGAAGEPCEGFPGGTVDKKPPANAGDMGLIPGPGRPHVLHGEQLSPCVTATEAPVP